MTRQMTIASNEGASRKTGVQTVMIGAERAGLKLKENPDARKGTGARNRCVGFSMTQSQLVNNNAPDTFALMHIVKCLVDVVQRQRKGDKFIQFNLTLHILIHHAREF